MKKQYIKPEITTIPMSYMMEDPICSHSGKPGHGYGDGGHTGPPGQDPDKHHSNVSEEIWGNWEM